MRPTRFFRLVGRAPPDCRCETRGWAARLLLDGGEHAVEDVVDPGVVTRAGSVAKDLDGLAAGDEPGEFVDRQVGSLARAVHSEEAQAGDRRGVEVVLGEGEQLACSLGRRVGRERPAAGIRLAKRHLTVSAVDRRRRAEDKPLDPALTTGGKQVERAGHVDRPIALRILDGGPHAGQRRQVHHPVDSARDVQGRGDVVRVGQITLDQAEARVSPQPREIPFLHARG